MSEVPGGAGAGGGELPATEEARIGVLGAGAWGTALASLLAKAGHRVRLWAYEAEVADAVNAEHRNERYLGGVDLPPGLVATADAAHAVSGAQVVVSVAPAQFVDGVLDRAAAHVPGDALVVSASKGIETTTLRRMDQVLAEHLPGEQARSLTVLSGPSFAAEVAREMPTAVVVASRDESARLRAQRLFQTEYFRVYTNPDVLGVELGGALKNVIAVAAGMVAGLDFGRNTQAALLTRGLAEIKRLGVAMGAEAATFSGLAGMGDLVLTCTSELSRNRTVGFRLGRGETLDEILEGMDAVAEGVKTCQAVRGVSRRHEVEMPISDEVHAILFEGREPREALRVLMTREPKPEEWW